MDAQTDRQVGRTDGESRGSDSGTAQSGAGADNGTQSRAEPAQNGAGAQSTAVSPAATASAASVAPWNGEMDHLDAWGGWDAFKEDPIALKTGLRTGLELKTAHVERGNTAAREALAAERRAFELERSRLERLQSLLLDDEPVTAPQIDADSIRAQLKADKDFVKEVLAADSELQTRLERATEHEALVAELDKLAFDQEFDEVCAVIAEKTEGVLEKQGDVYIELDPARFEAALLALYTAPKDGLTLAARLRGERPWTEDVLNAELARLGLKPIAQPQVQVKALTPAQAQSETQVPTQTQAQAPAQAQSATKPPGPAVTPQTPTTTALPSSPSARTVTKSAPGSMVSTRTSTTPGAPGHYPAEEAEFLERRNRWMAARDGSR